MRKYCKVAIIGVGLIGGSIGLALKKKRLAYKVIGVGHRASSIKKAKRLKTIDKGTLSLRNGLKDTDIIILATPVLTIPNIAKNIKRFAKKGAIVTDVGSVKSFVVESLEKILPKGIDFVGAHPMAGSEKRGVDKARADLFKNSICILTQAKKTNLEALGVIKRLWKDIGARVVVLSPELHDGIVSQISHLPHMVVFALLNSIKQSSIKFASTGFFDTTRIASSDAKVWKDIAISNKHEILKDINIFKKRFSALEGAIRRKDSRELLSIFNSAKEKRDDHSNRRTGRER